MVCLFPTHLQSLAIFLPFQISENLAVPSVQVLQLPQVTGHMDDTSGSLHLLLVALLPTQKQSLKMNLPSFLVLNLKGESLQLLGDELDGTLVRNGDGCIVGGRDGTLLGSELLIEVPPTFLKPKIYTPGEPSTTSLQPLAPAYPNEASSASTADKAEHDNTIVDNGGI